MGNSLGGRRKAKVMRIDGSSFKMKPPAAVKDVLRDNPGFVLLDADQVKNLGVRAKPLDDDLPLKPNKLYFLVELPKLPSPLKQPESEHHRQNMMGARRVRSGINMSAKDRLENLMLSRRAVSDLSAFARPPPPSAGGSPSANVGGGGVVEAGEDGTMRVRMRLPKAQVARLMEESRDAKEAAEKIMELCVAGGGHHQEAGAAGGGGLSGGLKPATNGAAAREKKEKRMRFALGEDQIID